MGKRIKNKRRKALNLIIIGFILIIFILVFYVLHGRKNEKGGIKDTKFDLQDNPGGQYREIDKIIPGKVNIINESLDENETYRFEVFNALNYTVDCNATIFLSKEAARSEIGKINIGKIGPSKIVPESFQVQNMPKGISTIEAKPSCI